MYCINFSGGDNKTHGQIERADRIDSFQVPTNRGLLIASRAGSTFPLHCEHFFEEKREVVELYHPGSRWRCTLAVCHLASVETGRSGCAPTAATAPDFCISRNWALSAGSAQS